MANSTQMLKGLLEGCILKIVSTEETYGYAVCEKLIQYGFEDISESSVYPILIRLEKKNLLYSKMKKSPLGPMRKYYYLTHDGVEELEEFISTWNLVKRNVENVLEG
ncbi:transcriptional regulator%2C Acidobacterial%2C PadR-family [uncultured Clostridium sp.]|uniref:PadR family transcriptional regulator n=1 Tax=uncultured Clostridium sp. TaxID=59620 RepID=UPI000820A4C4|nr:PadR family transcriptional regulator [uncultured Clostridium sp.]SCJ62746.1 transcriptional regulator%2C Acidobacterial%2C PadR-family [uncultured Clostridium sp.]